MRLLTYSNLNVSAGISHQKSNLAAMIREAVLGGRDLIAPQFRLAGSHNRDRPLMSQLDEYFDFSRIKAGGHPVNILKSVPNAFQHESQLIARNESLIGRCERMITKEMRGVGLIRIPLEAIYKNFAKLPVQIPIYPTLIRIGQAVFKQIPCAAAWVHVRRGDRLQQTAKATSPENIHRVLQSVSPATKAVYIATNEKNLRFFDFLRKHYQLLCFEYFDELKALSQEDNYKLFLTEQALGSYFPVRISTFRVKGSYFHGSLCNTSGWQ